MLRISSKNSQKETSDTQISKNCVQTAAEIQQDRTLLIYIEPAVTFVKRYLLRVLFKILHSWEAQLKPLLIWLNLHLAGW